MHVSVSLDLVCRSRFARDAIAGHLRTRRGPAGGRHQLEHVPHSFCRSGPQHRSSRDQAIGLEQRRGFHFAVGGKDRVGARQLNQVHRDAVSVGHRRLLDRTPRLCRTQPSGHFAGKSGLGRRAETRAGKHLPHGFRRQAQRDLGGAHVRGFLDHLLHGERTFRVCIVNRVAADRQHARRGFNHGVGAHAAGFERGRDGERLQRRSRLEDVG